MLESIYSQNNGWPHNEMGSSGRPKAALEVNSRHVTAKDNKGHSCFPNAEAKQRPYAVRDRHGNHVRACLFRHMHSKAQPKPVQCATCYSLQELSDLFYTATTIEKSEIHTHSKLHTAGKP